MSAALRAEWTKLRTVPDAAIAVPLIGVLTAAVSVIAAGFDSPDAVQSSLLGVQVGQAAVAVWAVQTMAAEHSTGMARTTFAALPRRLTVLLAKAVLLLGGVLAAVVPAVLASVLAGRSMLAGYPALTSATVLRAAGGSVLYLGLIALLALGLAAAVRGAVAATGIVLGLLMVPAMLSTFADPDLQRLVYKLSPSTAGMTVLSTVDTGTLPIGPWQGLGVAAAWSSGLLALGALLLARRDV